MDYAFLVNRILAGTALGLTLYFLRSNLDRGKGLLVESASVVLPLLFAALALPLCVTDSNFDRFLKIFADCIQLVFLTVPLFIVVRIIERQVTGDPVHLLDLFRVTTAIGLAAFVYANSLSVFSISPFLLVAATCIFGEKALESKHLERSVAIAFSVSFLLAIWVDIYHGTSILELLSDGAAYSLRTWTGSLSLLAMLGCILAAPKMVNRWLRASRRFQTWIWRLSAWCLSTGHPRDLYRVNPLARLWQFRPGTRFLNHGSFGAVPWLVRDYQRQIQSRCQDQPMDFLARELENHWLNARVRLATWLGTSEDNIAFCENATAAMNEIAAWFPLQPGDEVLLNDHEYGAVRRIWQRKCEQSQASLSIAVLPQPFRDRRSITDAVLAACTPRTKLVVVSHITSPTATILPIEEICSALAERNIASCVDGPHALLQENLQLARLKCDFYTASCHKWLCAPLGSGFVYAAPSWHEQIRPARLSWGRLQPKQPTNWSDELLWTGTRDQSPYLAIPEALRFFQAFDAQRLDARNHGLACYARSKLSELPGAEPVTPAGRDWFGWMVAVWLPKGDHSKLQQSLFDKYGIEVPIVFFNERYLVRVSCHLYNTVDDIHYLCAALRRELG